MEPAVIASGNGRSGLAWSALPRAAQIYLAAVIAAGAVAFAAFLPHSFPRPVLFALLVVTACLTSLWKVNLPIPLSSGSTLSMSYAANLMALMLLGPSHAVFVGAAGVWTQCTFNVKRRYPAYRTIFSVAAEAITMVATGFAYTRLGGPTSGVAVSGLAKPVVGAIGAYFAINTGLVTGAIALSTAKPWFNVWREAFLWSAPGFMVAGTAGATAAIIVARGSEWRAVIMIAPVLLTYGTYKLFVGYLQDQRRHVVDTRRQHRRTLDALAQAHAAERALAAEKERLAAALADMTRLESARNELLEREQAARASAEQANRLKDQFLAIVSHELRTPLTAVLGWADLLQRGLVKDNQRDAAIQAIYRSARRQAQLIDDLLDVARIISGKLRLDQRVVDLESLVRDAIHVVQVAADAKRIQITLDISSPPGAMFADGTRLQQIASNLLSNAVKFTPEGGCVHVRLRRLAEDIELAISDTGQGIAPEFLGSVFEPFRQADPSTTREQGGLGLGLSIVRHLVEAHGGTVTAASDGPGRGATFIVRLPGLVPWGDRPVGDRAVEHAGVPAGATASLDGLSVLVVDDDEENREMVAAYLQGRNAVVLTASSAAQALEVVQRERVDVLLADIAMPGEDGYALVKKIRELNSPRMAGIPAAALTAFAREEDRLHALQAGFQLHIAKPVDAELLVAAVANLGRLSVS